MNDLKTFKLIAVAGVIFYVGFNVNVLGYVKLGGIIMFFSTPFILYAIFLTIIDIFTELY